MSIYADPKRIYDLLNSQTTRIREQDAEIERLKAEVERLRRLAPWHDKPRVEVIGGHYRGFYGRLIHQTENITDVVLEAESAVMAEAMHSTPIGTSHVRIISQPEEQ